MMTQAFYSGVSGVKTHSAGIDVISNDLANISTAGYKGSSYEFSSLFNNMLNTGGSVDSTIGTGTRLSATPMMKGIGSEILSDKSTDMAILDNGWFGVQGEGKPIYTRDGNFTFDQNDDLITQDGYHVLGTMGGNIKDGILTKIVPEISLGSVASQKKLNFPKSLTYPPEASTVAKFIGNIGTDDKARIMSATVVDANNEKHELQLKFTKKATQNSTGSQWNVTAVVKNINDGTVYDTQTGSVSFNEKGALISSTLTTIDNNGSPVKINLGKGFDGVVSFANIDITSSSMANGTVRGDLRGYDVNKNGEIIATFTNGIQSSVGKIAVYHFTNEQGLERLNGSHFKESTNSGKALFFKDAQGNSILGTDITNFKLEGSNVSMEYGLTELMILQRSYAANAKSITTADQMMQKALNMGA